MGRMEWSLEAAPQIAETYVRPLGRRWAHVQTAGRLAETLVTDYGAPKVLAPAAWLHDIGYSPDLAVTGFHPLDGANFLKSIGADDEVVSLVAYHSGASVEAAERGLSDELSAIPAPNPDLLDALTLVDLTSAPDGQVTNPVARVREILSRYPAGDVVHRSVSCSKPTLLAAAERARTELALPDVWGTAVERVS